MKRILSLCFIGTLAFSLTGCDFLDELLEPEQKEYTSTIYNKVEKKDEDFNYYDGKPSEETPAVEEEVISDDDEGMVVETNDRTYSLDYTNVKEWKVQTDTYSFTYNVPNSLIDYSLTSIKKPTKVINLKKNSWSGPFCMYSGNDGTTLKMVNAVYDNTIMEDTTAMVTMASGTLDKFKESTSTRDMQEGNVLQLTVNGDTTVSYRIYPYTNANSGPSAIIMACAQINDTYFYTELWLTGIYENFDYEDLLVNIYSSINATPVENLILE